MKKIFLAIAILTSTIAAYAEDDQRPLIDHSLIADVLSLCGVLLVIYLISMFILQLVRNSMDYRLKSKIIEKGTAGDIVGQLVQSETKKPDNDNTLMQWLWTMVGIGIGFTGMQFTRPLGLHSLAIMAFCVAAGLGGYYFFSRKNKK